MILSTPDGLRFDSSEGVDISIAIANAEGALAWYVDHPIIEPVMTEHFTGSVELGGSVNFRNVFFNPHGNGTHTECVGHISKEFVSINDVWSPSILKAKVISIDPVKLDNGDLVLDLSNITIEEGTEALVLRTLPNEELKKSKNHSAQNSPYILPDSFHVVLESNVKHLLIDQPSVDREEDGGELICHHMFWNYPEELNYEKTITELIYVPNSIEDGIYLLNMSVASFKNDAAPSRPTLYPILS